MLQRDDMPDRRLNAWTVPAEMASFIGANPTEVSRPPRHTMTGPLVPSEPQDEKNAQDASADATFEDHGHDNGHRYWWQSDLMRLLGYDNASAFSKAIG